MNTAEEDIVDEMDANEPGDRLHFVSGDATKPFEFAAHDAESSSSGGVDDRFEHKYSDSAASSPAIASDRGALIVCCVDDSGSWGRGGFFRALSALSPAIGKCRALQCIHDLFE